MSSQEKTFCKINEDSIYEFKNDEAEGLREELKKCKEIMANMQERFIKTEKFYNREKAKKYRNCGTQTSLKNNGNDFKR
jgi:hypothetical protein